MHTVRKYRRQEFQMVQTWQVSPERRSLNRDQTNLQNVFFGIYLNFQALSYSARLPHCCGSQSKGHESTWQSFSSYMNIERLAVTSNG